MASGDICATERVKVARRYGVSPGQKAAVECHFCTAVGFVYFWPLTGRQRVGWVSLIDLEWDHFIPRSKGGPDTADNIVLSCRRCNRSRCNRDVPTWLKEAGVAANS